MVGTTSCGVITPACDWKKTFDYVVDYLLTFSNHAKLIEPQPLIDGYLKKLRTLLNQYAD